MSIFEEYRAFKGLSALKGGMVKFDRLSCQIIGLLFYFGFIEA